MPDALTVRALIKALQALDDRGLGHAPVLLAPTRDGADHGVAGQPEEGLAEWAGYGPQLDGWAAAVVITLA
ncbi:hypothetical protein [Deinococcus radiotolerans]|uniref:Uncharacterized protein n=1 Tax=Deinococcus radiotolerans TaxID=1309407 RepID=A0ABQ2FQJ6_9DEIO|nr:hypothetical protein [Deinococcus radiotolerans]GGL16788.1 hypothetical protein GCM10010844_39650 [Deinococcus radiotolerans]